MVCTGLGRSLGRLYRDAPRLRRSACGSRWCHNACAGRDSFGCRGGHGYRDSIATMSRQRRDGIATVSRRLVASRQLQRQACPVRKVVTVAWDPHPRAPVEGVLRVVGVLESRTLERRGKRALVVGLGRRGHLESFPAQVNMMSLALKGVC
ncbi:hypothetical protein Taro_052380 [Colocasia esculenta]|uniref:Uncharacterized protein n=1 Tax=Colocasia esculenta TaxID=4460 RepID=A0A843XJ72_COLES|nr:hypothetical protein [Colocasia esculenta]